MSSASALTDSTGWRRHGYAIAVLACLVFVVFTVGYYDTDIDRRAGAVESWRIRFFGPWPWLTYTKMPEATRLPPPWPQLSEPGGWYVEGWRKPGFVVQPLRLVVSFGAAALLSGLLYGMYLGLSRLRRTGKRRRMSWVVIGASALGCAAGVIYNCFSSIRVPSQGDISRIPVVICHLAVPALVVAITWKHRSYLSVLVASFFVGYWLVPAHRVTDIFFKRHTVLEVEMALAHEVLRWVVVTAVIAALLMAFLRLLHRLASPRGGGDAARRKLMVYGPAGLLGMAVVAVAAWWCTLGEDTNICGAAGHGDVRRVRAILSAHPELLKSGGGFRTPLHYAAEYGQIGVVRLLLDRGADVDAGAGEVGTPLHRAATLGRIGAAELLLARGADVNAKDRIGRTPLHEAVMLGHEYLVSLLLKKGADTNAKDDEGYTPLAFARLVGWPPAIAELIKRHEAKE